jgi:hypothetical protein
VNEECPVPFASPQFLSVLVQFRLTRLARGRPTGLLSVTRVTCGTHFQVCLEFCRSDLRKEWMSSIAHCHWLVNQSCTQRSAASSGSCMTVRFQHFSSQMLSSQKPSGILAFVVRTVYSLKETLNAGFIVEVLKQFHYSRKTVSLMCSAYTEHIIVFT